jgi:transcriptional regulator with XRE-family HTH domain
MQGERDNMDMTPTKKLGKLIARHRKAARLSQEGLGALAGLAGSTIQRYETGFIEQPDPYKLLRIAEALDIEVEELYAAAGLKVSSQLPAFGTYLRTRYGQLPEKALKEVEAHFEELRQQYEEGK